jgi:hypothetical protein
MVIVAIRVIRVLTKWGASLLLCGRTKPSRRISVIWNQGVSINRVTRVNRVSRVIYVVRVIKLIPLAAPPDNSSASA